ncbi:hypothetical protein ACO2Q3_13700 [Caulobacter sp. KR2-114]
MEQARHAPMMLILRAVCQRPGRDEARKVTDRSPAAAKWTSGERVDVNCHSARAIVAPVRRSPAAPSRPACADKGSVTLSDAYQAQAHQDADLQLRRAAVRIAVVLNRALR